KIATGFFSQDDPAADGAAIGALPPRFGLLDDSPQRWKTFQARIDTLNADAPSGTRYKVFYFSRHGQGGADNVAEAKYGTKVRENSPTANRYWSKLNGDGEMTWGPDPELTDVGIQQAKAARQAWKKERAHGIPLPERHYGSPFQRALRTFHDTFVDADFLEGRPLHITILENLREEYGEHTCDLRSTRSAIAQRFPPPVYEFEEGFKEEDTIWQADKRETKEHVAQRAHIVLDRIFSTDNETYICISAHSGIINGFLSTMGRPRYPLPTGGEWIHGCRFVFLNISH
ncbi:histidine phosphatase superfamily, partial [Dichomitus squalens]